MSLIKNVLLKNYMNDIYEASDGFFLSMADEIDFDDPREMYSPVKLHMADKYGFSDLSVPEIDEHFCKYLKYNKYDVMEELHLERPTLKDVIQVYANDRVVYATLVMDLRMDISDYIANAFYKSICGQTIFSYLDNDTKIKHIEYYIQARFEIDDLLKKFKVKSVVKYKPHPRIPKNGIKYDNNMVPDTDDYEHLAKCMREKYSIKAPVNLDTALYEIGLNVDESYSLDKNTHGLVCISDGFINNYNKLVKVKENTILMDKDHISNYGVGSYRFNVLHEMVHFEYHKYYLTLKRQLSDYTYAISDNIKLLKRIEEQANKVASLLLVPSEELYSKLLDNYMKYDFFISNDKFTLLNRISNQLSEYFNCSKTCMHQRIKAINFYTGGIDLTEIDSTYINEDEVNYIYNNNEEFKELIDSKQVVYSNKRCVINTTVNYDNNTITHYAYKNPRTSMLTFSRVHRHRYNSSNEFFTHITVTKELCDKALKAIKDKKLSAHIDYSKFVNMLFKEDQVSDLVVDDIGRTIKRLREHKNMSYAQLSMLSDVHVQEIHRLEHNENKTYNLKSLTLICRALKLPKNTTIKILQKAGGFENTLFDKAVQFVIENDYEKDPYELAETIENYRKIAEIIENENKLMQKA